MSDEWYYVDKSGQQQGPITEQQFIDAFKRNTVDLQSLCWNPTLSNWQTIDTTPSIKSKLLQPAPAPVPQHKPQQPAPRPAAPQPVAQPTQQQPSAAPQSNNNSNASPQPAATNAFAAARANIAAGLGTTVTSTPAAARPNSGNSSNAASPVKPAAVLSRADQQQTPGNNIAKNVAAMSLNSNNNSTPTNKPATVTTTQQPTPTGGSTTPRGMGAIKANNVPAHGWRELKTADGQFYYYNANTQQTQWDRPAELQTVADTARAGDWYWIPSQTDGYVAAKLVQQDAMKYVCELETGQQITVTKKSLANQPLERLYWTELNDVQSDLVMLNQMTRGLVLHNLKQRFIKQQIYTNVGTILISINPYQNLPLYTPTLINEYINRGSRTLPPHVYTIADNAYNSMLDNRTNQSIVISGESGAGKTEATKHCLQYLAECAGSQTTSNNTIEQRILLTNPILEAFGNAKTVRNNNSSRFGKYVEIYFDARTNKICGCSTTNYLLEKSRVVLQNPNERNYHVFYQLLSGAPAVLKQKLRLKNTTDYWYLNQSQCTTVDSIDDAKDYVDVISAMQLLGFDQTEIDQCYTLVAAVLHIGNIEFQPSGDRQCIVSSSSTGALTDASQLLSLDPIALKTALCNRQMNVQGQEAVTIGLSVEQAKAARDAIAKFIYEKLFDWLVQRINAALQQDGKTVSTRLSIGILDIFGFEIFEHNSYEQLAINYTNEKLQKLFNNNTFTLEEQLYASENIQFQHVQYVDNQPVLDLIDLKPNGLLPSIDEELRVPRGSDQSWLNKMNTVHESKKEYVADRGSKTNFNVVHYAGVVSYDSTNFLEKNRDQLTDDAYALLQSSGNAFLASLFPPQPQSQAQKRATLATKFTRQLNDLMQALQATTTHYIRCIKPNPSKSSTIFAGAMVNEQLSYSGVFEAITIRKSGYPFRYTHNEFWQRYKCIFERSHPWSSSVVANCKTLIHAMKQSEQDIQIGRTRVLYRAAQHRQIELQRNLAVEAVTTVIQSYIRRKVAVNIYNQCKSIEPKLQALYQQNTESSIDEALSIASALPYKPRIVVQLERSKFVITETKRLNSLLTALLDQNVNEYYDQYSSAVAAADDIQLNTAQANQCRAVLNEAKAERQQIDQDTTFELKRLDEAAMKNILSHAESINYTTPDTQRLHDLLYNTNTDEFTKLQMKAAIALQDKTREIRCTIKLKDLTFNKIGQLFVFSTYPKLCSPAQWADLKFLSMNKTELAQSMLQHTRQPIHAPLTQMAQQTPRQKECYKHAKVLFKNILAYMGDRPYKTPSTLAAELLAAGYNTPELRTELYCQIIKQLTQNGDATSRGKGFELLLLMVYTFPPPPDFENFLEQWLRQNATPMKQYVNTLHQTLYGPAKPAPPSEAQFDAILRELSAYTTMEFCPAATIRPLKEVMVQQAEISPMQPVVRVQPQPAQISPIRLAQQQPQQQPTTNGYAASQQQQQQMQPAQAVAPAIAPKPKPQIPPPAPAGYIAKPKVPEPTQEIYVITKTGEQLGPLPASDVKARWQQGAVDEQCICWHCDLSEWTKIGEVEPLLMYLKQT